MTSKQPEYKYNAEYDWYEQTSSKRNVGIFIHPTNWAKFLGRQNKINYIKSYREWIKDITLEEPEWVKDRRLEYLENQIVKTELTIFRFIVRSGLSPEKLRKNVFKMKREISMWNSPITKNKTNITDEQIEQAKNEDWEKFIEIGGRYGDKLKALCPFHEDHNPSLILYPEGRGYHCFSCGAHGDLIDFIMKTNNLKFIDSVKFILNI